VALTRGELEAQVSERLIQFAKEYLGRGPEGARTRIFEDVVFVRLSGVLTRAEKKLVGEPDGAPLIKEMRLRLIESGRQRLEATVAECTGCQVVELYTDLSTQRGEQIVVFTLDRCLDDVEDKALPKTQSPR